MAYEKLSFDIVENIGGEKNIKQLTHCATRLRFEFYDESKVETEKIKNLKGIIGVVQSGGQYQIVVGNDVQQVYRNILNNTNPKDNLAKKQKNTKTFDLKNLISNFISTISTTFTPMIPAITGSGMIKALLAILTLTGILDSTDYTYYILNTISDAAFYFMPMLLAYGAAQKFKCNPVLAITLAGVLLHPNLNNLLNTNQAVNFIGIPFKLAEYSGTVLPIIITVWVMSYIEDFAEKVSPSIIKFFTKPLIVIFITAPLALIVIGPFGIYLNDVIMKGAEFIDGKASWLIPMLMGTLQPLLIITGTAWAMTPIATMQLSNYGQEMINGPGMLASNIAQSGATLCVALKSKNSGLKQLATSSGVTALFGITEPALYGVTLKLRKPLIASMIGGGIAGTYAGSVGLVRYAFVSPGLAALPAFIGKNPMNIVHALVTCILAFSISFIATWIIGFEEEKEESFESDKNIKKKSFVKSPLTGDIKSLKDVDDHVFSNELLGKGIAIIPKDGKLYSPINGIVEALFETKHAIAIQSDDDVKVLMHIGIDTVKLDGKYFDSKVKQGQIVKQGDELISFNLEKLKELGYNMITPIILVDSENHEKIEIKSEKFVSYGETIFEIN